MDVSDITFTGLLNRSRSFLRNEYGFEAFYNVAITPWLTLTPDIQFIRPGQKNSVSLNRRMDDGLGIPTLDTKNVNLATIFGLRLKIDF